MISIIIGRNRFISYTSLRCLRSSTSDNIHDGMKRERAVRDIVGNNGLLVLEGVPIGRQLT